MSKIKKQQIKMWQNIIPDLRKSIDLLVKQHRQKPIRTYPPEDFHIKLNTIRSVIESEEIFDEEEYLDVFAFLIEERSNTSLLELGDQLANKLGKNHEFWTGKIQRWANLFALTSSSTLWNVTDFMRNYVNYGTSPIQRHNIYQWRLKAQSYLSSIEFLIRKISSPKIHQSSSYSMDDHYMKYYKAKVVYTTFVSTQYEMGLHQSEENDELSITNKDKRKAEMKLFNFGVGTKKLEYVFEDFGNRNGKKSMNTLEKYFCNKKSQKNQEVRVLNDEEQRIMRQKEFVYVLRNVGNNHQHYSIDDLRKQVKNQKQKQRQERIMKEEQDNTEAMMRKTKVISMVRRMNQNNSEEQHPHLPKFTVKQREFLDSLQLKQYPISHFTFIFDQRDYFHYFGYRIPRRDIQISNPFILYPWVNYWINDQQEYDDLIAIDLDDQDTINSNSNQSTDSQDTQSDQDSQDNIFNDQSFIDHRKVVVSGYIDGNSMTAQDLIQFKNQIHQSDKKWVANFKIQKQQNKDKIKESHEIIVNQQSRYKNLGLQVIPVYGGQLPYPIEANQTFRTKRRDPEIKSKFESIQYLNPGPYKMEEIAQISQQGNSTSNQILSNSIIQKLEVIECIQEVKLEKEDDFHGIQTTFEQKADEKLDENRIQDKKPVKTGIEKTSSNQNEPSEKELFKEDREIEI